MLAVHRRFVQCIRRLNKKNSYLNFTSEPVQKLTGTEVDEQMWVSPSVTGSDGAEH